MAGRLGGWTPHGGNSVGIVLEADQFGIGLALVAGLLMTCALAYSCRYFESVRAQYQALMLLFLAGMTGFALTGDLFNMFVFFELMGVCAYAPTGIKTEEPSSVQGALNFGIISSFGGYLTLAGIGLVYARAGRLSLPLLSQAPSGKDADALISVDFMLIITGFVVKAPIVSFHFWRDGAHAVAPTPVGIMISCVMVELGLNGVGRVYWAGFSDARR